MMSLSQAIFGEDVDPFGNSSRPFCPRKFNCSTEPSSVSFDIGRIPSYMAIASGSASCLGAILIVLVFLSFRELRTGAQKIITLLAVADFITAVSYIIGSINFLVYFNEEDSKKCKQFEIICEVQASVTSLSSLCSIYWTLILAFYFYLEFVYNRRPLALRLFPLYYIIAWGAPFLVIVPLIGLRKLGYAPYATANWCFIKEIRYNISLLDSDGYKSIIFIFLAGKFWEILTYFGVIITYAHITGHISRLGQHCPCYQNQDAEVPVQQQLPVVAGRKRFISIPVFFLLLRLWGTVQFFYSIAMSGKLKNHDGCLPKGVRTGFYILGIVQAIGDPGQGWSNAILFVFMSPVMRERLFRTIALRPRPRPRPPGNGEQRPERPRNGERRRQNGESRPEQSSTSSSTCITSITRPPTGVPGHTPPATILSDVDSSMDNDVSSSSTRPSSPSSEYIDIVKSLTKSAHTRNVGRPPSASVSSYGSGVSRLSCLSTDTPEIPV